MVKLFITLCIVGFHHEANGDFETVTEFNGCDRRNLRMHQQHCSYSTILT
jgi:hypothetical protein